MCAYGYKCININNVGVFENEILGEMFSFNIVLETVKMVLM